MSGVWRSIREDMLRKTLTILSLIGLLLSVGLRGVSYCGVGITRLVRCGFGGQVKRPSTARTWLGTSGIGAIRITTKLPVECCPKRISEGGAIDV